MRDIKKNFKKQTTTSAKIPFTIIKHRLLRFQIQQTDKVHFTHTHRYTQYTQGLAPATGVRNI